MTTLNQKICCLSSKLGLLFPFFGMPENNIRHFYKLSFRRNNLNIVKGHNAIWKILSKLKMTRLIHLQNTVLEICVLLDFWYGKLLSSV